MRISRPRLAVFIIIAGCQTAPAPTPTSSAPAPTRGAAAPGAPSATGPLERGIVPRKAPPLPEIPLVTGPLTPRVVFPEPNQSIPVRDSNFIFGSVGNGH